MLDLGGTPLSWSTAPMFPGELTLLNMDPYESDDRARCLTGDVCDPPSDLADAAFDLVYSNSVIEHLGGYKPRRAFADVVKRLAPHHWIQTPARSFPIEPHWLFPGFQFLPVGARAWVSQLWPLGMIEADRGDRYGATEDVLSVDLLGAAEMRHLFDDSEILHERFAGLTKSFIAAR